MKLFYKCQILRITKRLARPWHVFMMYGMPLCEIISRRDHSPIDTRVDK